MVAGLAPAADNDDEYEVSFDNASAHAAQHTLSRHSGTEGLAAGAGI